VFDWLWWEFAQRNPRLQRPTVCLCDGQEALWEACAEAVGDEDRVDILDLLHVTPRLWQAGKLLYGAQGKAVLPFVRQRVTQVLEGKVESVIRGLRRLATAAKLSGEKRKSMRRLCRYLYKNRHRMHYDEYLRAGYPIASGVIEGACRHLIKDRMDITGARWGLAGAEAILKLRAIKANDDFDAYWQYHLTQERHHVHEARYQNHVIPQGKQQSLPVP
jgi:hypothetical protein